MTRSVARAWFCNSRSSRLSGWYVGGGGDELETVYTELEDIEKENKNIIHNKTRCSDGDGGSRLRRRGNYDRRL